jgi:hypothetical protein
MSGFITNGPIGTLFIDLSKAFDTVSQYIIEKSLGVTVFYKKIIS